MKKKHFAAAFLGVCCLAVWMGCSSAPEADQIPAPETPRETEGGADVESADFDKVEQARQAAVAAGARELYPAEFSAADARYESAKSLDAASEILPRELAELADWYRSLEMAAKARQAAQTIEKYGFRSEYPDGCAAGDAALSEWQSLYGVEGSGAQAYAKAKAAYDAYMAALSAGLEKYIGDVRDKAYRKKAEADSIKSSVAVKDMYASAAGMLSAADKDAEAGLYESAYTNYVGAYDAFCQVYDTALAKRNVASAAIDQARKKADETEQYASEADQVAPIPEDDIADSDALRKELGE